MRSLPSAISSSLIDCKIAENIFTQLCKRVHCRRRSTRVTSSRSRAKYSVRRIDSKCAGSTSRLTNTARASTNSATIGIAARRNHSTICISPDPNFFGTNKTAICESEIPRNNPAKIHSRSQVRHFRSKIHSAATSSENVSEIEAVTLSEDGSVNSWGRQGWPDIHRRIVNNLSKPTSTTWNAAKSGIGTAAKIHQSIDTLLDIGNLPDKEWQRSKSRRARLVCYIGASRASCIRCTYGSLASLVLRGEQRLHRLIRKASLQLLVSQIQRGVIAGSRARTLGKLLCQYRNLLRTLPEDSTNQRRHSFRSNLRHLLSKQRV